VCVLNEGCNCQFSLQNIPEKSIKKNKGAFLSNSLLESFISEKDIFFTQKLEDTKYFSFADQNYILGVTWKNCLDLATTSPTGHYK
jgi:hypothetical protein